MFDTIKDFLAKHKVKLTVAGGALVLATAYGTCTFDAAEQASNEAAETTEATAIAVSNVEATATEAATTEATTTEAADEAAETEAVK